MPKKKMNLKTNLNVSEPQRNEGCYNCGRSESYPGADNDSIRYLCGTCTAVGLARLGRDEFERLEAERKEAKKPLLRVTRKKKEPKKTLSSC